jgi:hyperosmotically inducible protein
MIVSRIVSSAILLCGLAVFSLSPGSFLRAQDPATNQKMQDRVSREVYHELTMLPQLTIFDHLAFKVDGDTVTLLGAVRNAVLKDEAEAVVKHIEGVEHVNNQIEVLPPSPDDDRIREQIARAIFNDPRLFKYSMGAVPPIHIIVKNRHVTLEGAVDSETDKNAAFIRANGVPGVFSVKNNLQVVNKQSKAGKQS